MNRIVPKFVAVPSTDLQLHLPAVIVKGGKKWSYATGPWSGRRFDVAQCVTRGCDGTVAGIDSFGRPLCDCCMARPKPTFTVKPAREAGPKREKQGMSCLDAAAEVLKQQARPMRSEELIVLMQEQKLWTSPGGKTPAATLYAAIITESKKKGEASRFRKAGKAMFELNGVA